MRAIAIVLWMMSIVSIMFTYYYKYTDYRGIQTIIDRNIQEWDQGWEQKAQQASMFGEFTSLLKELSQVQNSHRLANLKKETYQKFIDYLNQEGKTKKGREVLEKLVNFDPRDYRNHFRLAQQYLIEGKRTNARKSFKEAFAINPADMELFHAYRIFLEEESDEMALQNIVEQHRAMPLGKNVMQFFFGTVCGEWRDVLPTSALIIDGKMQIYTIALGEENDPASETISLIQQIRMDPVSQPRLRITIGRVEFLGSGERPLVFNDFATWQPERHLERTGGNTFITTGKDPILLSPKISLSLQKYQQLRVTMAVSKNVYE